MHIPLVFRVAGTAEDLSKTSCFWLRTRKTVQKNGKSRPKSALAAAESALKQLEPVQAAPAAKATVVVQAQQTLAAARQAADRQAALGRF